MKKVTRKVKKKTAPTRGTPSVKSTVRKDVFAELDKLGKNKDYRAKKVEESLYKEVKGKEHWVLCVLVEILEKMDDKISQMIADTQRDVKKGTDWELKSFADLRHQISELKENLISSVAKTKNAIVDDLDEKSVSLNTSLSDTMKKTVEKHAADLLESFLKYSDYLKNESADTRSAVERNYESLTELDRKLDELGGDLRALEESLRIEIQETTNEVNRPNIEKIDGMLNELKNLQKNLGGFIESKILIVQDSIVPPVNDLHAQMKEVTDKVEILVKTSNKHLDIVEGNLRENMEGVNTSLGSSINNLSESINIALDKTLNERLATAVDSISKVEKSIGNVPVDMSKQLSQELGNIKKDIGKDIKTIESKLSDLVAALEVQKHLLLRALESR